MPQTARRPRTDRRDQGALDRGQVRPFRPSGTLSDTTHPLTFTHDRRHSAQPTVSLTGADGSTDAVAFPCRVVPEVYLTALLDRGRRSLWSRTGSLPARTPGRTAARGGHARSPLKDGRLPGVGSWPAGCSTTPNTAEYAGAVCFVTGNLERGSVVPLRERIGLLTPFCGISGTRST